MLLPAQRRAADDDAVLFVGRFQWLELASGTKIRQCRAIGFAASPAVSKAKCKMRWGVSIGVNGRACTSPRIAARKGCGVSLPPFLVIISTIMPPGRTREILLQDDKSWLKSC